VSGGAVVRMPSNASCNVWRLLLLRTVLNGFPHLTTVGSFEIE